MGEVIRLYRKMKSMAVLGCCRQGHVVKVWRWTRSEFEVKDKNGHNVLVIEGTGCSCCGPWACCGDLEFRVLTVDRVREVGRITKKSWTGIGNELLHDADIFHLTFPKDLDVSVKATLLGAALLIDFAFFEEDMYGYGS